MASDPSARRTKESAKGGEGEGRRRARARPAGTVLSRAFFAQDADVVARDLLGATLLHRASDGRAAVRLVETEAYFGPPGAHPAWPLGDPASHSHRGPTERNRAMWGPPGHAYVYLIYGANECMNVVTGREGDPQAVLLRAGEPLEGSELMRRRRGATRASGAVVQDRDLARGPGNLCRALGITRAHYGADLTRGSLRLESGAPPARVATTPRVNVVGGEDAPLRFVDADSMSVSGPRSSSPPAGTPASGRRASRGSRTAGDRRG